VDFRAGLDYVEKRKFLTLPGLELRPLDSPARTQSLYRLRYPGSCVIEGEIRNLCVCVSPGNYRIYAIKYTGGRAVA
jgi:hypothetical protein